MSGQEDANFVQAQFCTLLILSLCAVFAREKHLTYRWNHITSSARTISGGLFHVCGQIANSVQL